MTDTTDRELLILAAKAAGVEGEYESWTGQGFKEGIRQVLNGAKCLRPWNPLTDDGDALRLAVRLGGMLEITITKHLTQVMRHDIQQVLEQGDDPDANARRAIVLAAAEIGRAMP